MANKRKLPKELTTVTTVSKTLAFIMFVSFPIIGFLFGREYQRVNDLSQSPNTTNTDALPSSIPDMVDNSISYTIPSNWVKKIEYLETNGSYVSLYSPDYRYNSSDGPNNGMKLSILRQKNNSSENLKQQLMDQQQSFSRFGQTAYAEPYILGGISGFKSNPWNDLAFDPSYPKISVLKDGFIYTFVFTVFRGEAYHSVINAFLNSVKFL